MGLFEGLLGGGGGSADDPYADILTPAQRNQMQVQGLLAMAGAFAQAGMPSRLPVPFGSALGSAAAALGTGQEAGMKTAIENALAAQKVRDLRNMAEYRKKVLGDIDPTSPLGRAIDAINNPGGTTPTPGPTPAVPGAGGSGTSSGAASPAAPAAGGPLMMPASMLYPEPTGGGLLGPGDDTGLAGPTGKGVGLLSPGPAAASQVALSQDAAAAEVARLDAAYAASNPNASPAAKASVHAENIIRVNPPERGGSSTAPAEPDPGAGGDTPWGPTFAQTASGVVPARAGGQTYWTPAGLDALQPTEGRYDQIHYPSGYTREGVKSSASGGLGFIDPTWRQFASQAGVDLAKWPRAYMAPPEVQRAVAAITPVGHWTGVDAQGRPFNAAAQRLAANPAFVSGEPVAGPTAPGGGEDAGWGPTFAQGGPDRVIPSGAGGNLPITRAQYAPGGVGAAGGAVPGMPQLAPPTQLAPSGVPGLPGAPAQGPGLPQTPANQQAGLNALIVELARRNAASEVLGLGNPYNSLLTVLQGSPQYKAAVEAATEQARRTVGLPFIQPEAREKALGGYEVDVATRTAQANLDRVTNQIKDMGAAALDPAGTLLINGPNGPVERQVNRLQRATAQAGFDVPEIGFKGMRGPLPAGQIPGLPGVALPGAPGGPSATGAPGPGPQAQGVTPGGPGTLYDKPYQSPSDIKSSELGVTAGWKALQDTHAAEIAANRSDQQLGQIAEAMRGFTPGKTAEWRLTWGQYLKDAGFKIDGVSDGEIMQQAQRRLQLAAANVHEGSVSNFERGIYGETVTQLTNTPEGIVKAIGIQQRLNDYDRKVAQIHRDTIVNGVPNLVDAQSRIAKLGPPLSPGELSALQEIRAGQVPGKGQAATAPAPPDQHPLMRQQAADAIAKGAPRAGVIKRLQDMGVNTEGL